MTFCETRGATLRASHQGATDRERELRSKLKHRRLNDTARLFLSPNRLLQLFYSLWREKSLTSFQAHSSWHILNNNEPIMYSKRVSDFLFNHCFFFSWTYAKNLDERFPNSGPCCFIIFLINELITHYQEIQ